MIFDKFIDDSAIIACITGSGANSATSVLRISGFKSITDFSSCFSRSVADFKPRYCELVNIIDINNEILDNAIVSYFPAPNSYTGENVLEISIHGNRLNVERIIDFFIAKKLCRLAAPGEFSYRALKNGKLSLSQIEGLDLLLNAKSPLALAQGNSLLKGELHDLYLKLRESFLRLKAALELSLDFFEDVDAEQADAEFNLALDEFTFLEQKLFNKTIFNSKNLLTPSIVVFGAPNAGKSSFFNRLLAYDRSIVSHVPGTTRDYVSEFIYYNGVEYRFVDTAGIRSSDDFIEQEGIAFSQKLLRDSFFSILIVNPLEVSDSSFMQDLVGRADQVIYSHKDILGEADPNPLKVEDFLSYNFRDQNCAFQILLNKISDFYREQSEAAGILVERQSRIIQDIDAQFSDFRNLMDLEHDRVIWANALSQISHLLEELIGIVALDDVLDTVFGNFCIGK